MPRECNVTTGLTNYLYKVYLMRANFSRPQIPLELIVAGASTDDAPSDFSTNVFVRRQQGSVVDIFI